MAVDIPGTAEVAQEAGALGGRQAPPEAGGDGTEAVDHRAPVAPLFCRPPDLGAHAGGQGAEGGLLARGQVGRGPGFAGGVAHRQQPAAGESVDALREVAAAQADGDVDHGQAGAHDEDGQASRERALGLLAPGIGADAGIVVLFGREIADGEDDAVDLQALATGADERVAVSEGCDVDHLVGEEAEAGLAGGLAHRAAEDGAQIEAVEAARGEDAGGGVVQALQRLTARGAARDPVLEMERPVVQRAHIGGADVEQVVVILGRVGDPAAEGGGRARRAGRAARAGGD